MTTKTPEELLSDCSAWWDTEIIDIHPGQIAIRGYPIEQLIGRVRFPDMIWLMLRGDLPTRAQSELLEAALVPGVDHGPHAPSIAISCMAASCGLPVNGVMASAINVLDDVHGGAGQQCMELYREIDAEAGRNGDLVSAATTVRVRDGQTLVSDGPYAEVKESLGGYYLFSCDSIEEAVDWAAKIPAAWHGGAIEVRAIHVDEEAAA